MISHRFKTLLLFGAALYVVVICVAAEAEPQYQDPLGHYTFTLPAGWQDRTTGQDVTFASPDNSEEFIVSSEPANGGTLERAVQVYVPYLSSTVPGYQADPTGIQDSDLGGTPARQFAFQGSSGEQRPHSTLAVLAVHNDVLYLVFYLAFPPDPNIVMSPTAQTIFNSWQFTDGPGGSGDSTVAAGGQAYVATRTVATAEAHVATGTARAQSYFATGTAQSQGYAATATAITLHCNVAIMSLCLLHTKGGVRSNGDRAAALEINHERL